MAGTYIRFPEVSGGGVPVYATFGDLPGTSTNGDLAVVADTESLYVYNTGTSSWELMGSATLTVTTVGSFDSGSPSANGAHITGNSIFFQSASGSNPGMVSTGSQTFAGNKTFSGTVIVDNINAATGLNLTSASGTSPNQSGYDLVITAGDATQDSGSGSPGAIYLVSGLTSDGNSRGNINLDGSIISGYPATFGDTIAAAGNLTAANFSGSSSGTNTGDVTLAAAGSSPNSAGASLSGQALTLQPANGSNPGILTAGAQTIGGAKTFSSTISASNLSGTNTGDITLAAVGASPNANGATLTGQALNLEPANASSPGVILAGTQTIGGGKTIDGTADAVQLLVQGYSTQTNDIFRVEKSDATMLLAVDHTNSRVQVRGLQFPTTLSVIKVNTTSSPLVFNNSSDVEISKMGSNGTWVSWGWYDYNNIGIRDARIGHISAAHFLFSYLNAGIYLDHWSTTAHTAGLFVIQNNNAANKAMVIRGKTSQTANLQEWQNSATTTLASVDKDGNITAPLFTGPLTGNVTGTASGNTTYSANQYGVVLSGSGNAMSVLAPDASTSKVLLSGGSSANPSWALLGDISSATHSGQTSGFTAAAGNYYKLSGASFSVTLPAAGSNTGKMITFQHNDSTLGRVYTIGSVAKIATIGEVLTIMSDGSDWLIMSRRIPSTWVSYTPTLTGMTTSSLGARWRRVGDSIQVSITAVSNGAVTTNLAASIPSGLTIDTAKAHTPDLFGPALGFDGTGGYSGGVYYTSTTEVTCYGPSNTARWNATTPFTWGSGDEWDLNFTVPITDWEG